MEASRRPDQATGQAQHVADQAREKVGDATEQAKETARNMASQAQDRIREQVDQRSTEVGERVGSTAQDIRSVGEELRNQGKDGPAKVADQAADRIERAGRYLRDSDSDRILNDVEDFGRQRPWAVLAGAVMVGVAAARFLKASSRQRYATGKSGRSQASDGSGRRISPATTTPSEAAGVEVRGEPVGSPAGVR
jgi:hypothetical protein